MDRATFERQKAFAGETKTSMQRRCVDHDYTERQNRKQHTGRSGKGTYR